MKFNIQQTTHDYFTQTELVTREAFWDLYQPGCTEHLMVRQIRASTEYIPQLDHFAVFDDGTVAGHIIYTHSRLVMPDGEKEVITFGPISVLPEYQKMGIGSALIEHTKSVAKALGYLGVVIFGSSDYYPRFGFRDAREFSITTSDGGNFPEFMALPLWEGSLNGCRGRLYISDAYETTNEALEAMEREFPPKESCFKNKNS